MSTTQARTRKKNPPAGPSGPSALEVVRRLMRSTGFDEEEAYDDADNQLHFTSRDEGDIVEGRADPGTVQFARTKAKEIEAAVPGAKARTEVVDEWVSITVTLPPGSPPIPKHAHQEPIPTTRVEPAPKVARTLRPGDKVKYTNFTIGSSYEGTAIVTWDHGKSVEARTLYNDEKIRLERAADGSLRRFT